MLSGTYDRCETVKGYVRRHYRDLIADRLGNPELADWLVNHWVLSDVGQRISIQGVAETVAKSIEREMEDLLRLGWILQTME